MTIKITKLTGFNVRALNECLTEEEMGDVIVTKTTATFNMSAQEAIDLVEAAQSRVPTRQGHPYQSLHAVLNKLKNPAAPKPAPKPGKGPKVLRDLLKLDG